MPTLAVLPIKRLDAAKQRLVPALAAPGRRALAAAMAGDVLDALAEVAGLAATVVVAGDAGGRALAADHAAEVVPDPLSAGQSAAAALGVARALALGAARVLLVPGDCPALDPAELDRLLADAPSGPGVVVVPDRHATGTNGLLLAPPEVVRPAFGPGSRARHERAGADAGVPTTTVALPSLAHDVDTAADLGALRARRAAAPAARAARTRALLAAWAPAAA